MLPFGIKVYFVGDYFVNYIEYATELCENREDSELQCNGKCQLNKNLNTISTTKKDLPTPSSVHTVELSTFLIPTLVSLSETPESLTINRTYFIYLDNYTFNLYKTTSPPPEFV